MFYRCFDKVFLGQKIEYMIRLWYENQTYIQKKKIFIYFLLKIYNYSKEVIAMMINDHQTVRTRPFCFSKILSLHTEKMLKQIRFFNKKTKIIETRVRSISFFLTSNYFLITGLKNNCYILLQLLIILTAI